MVGVGDLGGGKREHSKATILPPLSGRRRFLLAAGHRKRKARLTREKQESFEAVRERERERERE